MGGKFSVQSYRQNILCYWIHIHYINNQKHDKHYLGDNTSLAAAFLKTAKIEENYAAHSTAKLYTAISQIGRLTGAKKLANADILLFRLIFFDQIHSFLTYIQQSEIYYGWRHPKFVSAATFHYNPSRCCPCEAKTIAMTVCVI